MDYEPTIPIDPARPPNLAPVTPDDDGTRLAGSVKTPASDESEELQRHLPQYLVREVVGRGGMGNVLKVDDPKLARTVALKTMKLGPEASEEQRGRFVREAAVLARLAHPNIVPIYDLGADDQGRPFYTMKLVKGRTLKDILKDLRQGTPDAAKEYRLERLLGVFRKVCDALAFAHSKGVLHRDLKPENIMVGEFGEVLVMDWGLAKFLHGADEAWSASALNPAVVEQSRASIGPANVEATLDGAIMGTPQYMSPEQAEGKAAELDERSDIFSLGAILYAILTLHPPVEGKSIGEVLHKISSGQIAPPSTFGAKSESNGAPPPNGGVVDARMFQPLPHCPGGRVPGALSAVTMKALSVDKTRRYQAVNEFSAEVEAWQTGFATRAEKAGLGRQVVLLIQRHKGVFTTAVAAWLIITALVVWFVIGIRARERRAVEGELTARTERDRAEAEKTRAEHETVRANAALSSLRKTAPALLQLAGKEADGQRFESALAKVDAALALDPAVAGGWWERTWLLTGLERWDDAIAAARLAEEKEPADGRTAKLLPVLEEFAAAPSDQERWKSVRTARLLALLQEAGATATLVKLSNRLIKDARPRLQLVQTKLEAWLGRDAAKSSITGEGLVRVENLPKSTVSIEPLRGLPIDELSLDSLPVQDLDPLRGMPLRFLKISVTQVKDLSPLRGMPLKTLIMQSCHSASDLTPLAGAPLEKLSADQCGISDLGPLQGAPLKFLAVADNRVIDLSPLAGAPLDYLSLNQNLVSDLTPLRGIPLKELRLYRNPVTSLEPLRGMPLRLS